jgi:hypothetical protein
MFTGKSCLKIIQAQKICSISRNVLRESNKILRRNISIKATKEQQEKLERELKFRKLNGKNEQDDGYDCWSFTDRAGGYCAGSTALEYCAGWELCRL